MWWHGHWIFVCVLSGPYRPIPYSPLLTTNIYCNFLIPNTIQGNCVAVLIFKEERSAGAVPSKHSVWIYSLNAVTLLTKNITKCISNRNFIFFKDFNNFKRCILYCQWTNWKTAQTNAYQIELDKTNLVKLASCIEIGYPCTRSAQSGF